MVLGVLGLAGTLASPAFADEFSGFRLGMNLSSDTLQSDLFFEPALDLVVDAADATQHFNTKRFGYGLFGGWALNRYFGVEAGLRSGSEFNVNPFDFLLADPTADFVVSHTDVKGIDLSAVGTLWIGRKFGIFGRAGMFYWKAEQTMSTGSYATETTPGSKGTVSVDDTGFEPMFGVGLQTVLDGALVRVEYQHTELGNLGTAGAFYLHDSTLESLNFSIVWTLH
ncbi:MAG TPA: outer membrane beta-barrel protein, partial [Steroidobacteraceae bacterium]|nr:outer membrane beta-barrel protein [Steroidobacteraceae bacterium]